MAAAAAVLGLAVPRPVGAQTCSIGFSPADYAMGAGARAVAVADFDRDGDLDVATADSAGTVTVRLNDGAGAFPDGSPTPPPPFVTTVGGSPVALVVADFNSDGRPDLAVADLNVPNNRIAVLINSGDWVSSGFGAPIFRNGLPSGARALAVGDFNRNGRADLAVATNTNLVSVLDGQGDGTFASPTNYSVGGPGAIPYDVVAGDFDRDGYDDFAALVDDASDYVSYRYGPGFVTQNTASISTAALHGVERLALADFNRDGRLDLAASGNDFSVPTSRVYLLEGNTGGGFNSPAGFYPTPSAAISLAAGDFDADGAPDIAVSNGDGVAPDTSILVGNGDGTFDPAVSIGADVQPEGAAAADLNRDGRDDLVVANAGPGNVRVHLNRIRTGNYACVAASFGPHRRAFPTGGPNPISVVRGELNGDGRLDLVVANYDADTIRVFLGTGFGELDPRPPITVGDGPYHVAIADFDGDARPDLAVANSGSNDVLVLRGDGTGNFAPFGPAQPVGQLPVSIEALDFDEDMRTDLAVANYVSGDVSILKGNGDGTFTSLAPVGLAGSNPTSLARGEFNGDGWPDLAVAEEGSHKVWLLGGDGTGGFAPNGFPAGGTGPRSLTVADFNADGKLDVATANYVSNTVSVLPGSGDGTLGSATIFGVGTGPQWIARADFEANGRPDLVTADQNGNTVTVLLNNGAGFSSSSVPLAGTPRSVEPDDFDRDGVVDIAVVAAQPQSIIVLRGDGAGSFAPAPPEYSAGPTPRLLSVADVDRDGFLDLVLPHGSNGVAVLPGLPGGAFGGPTILTAGSNPEQAVAGDFNRDGRVDLAVANGSSNQVSIFFGSPFGPASNLSVGGNQKSIATADFDQDGDLDLAVATGSSVRIYCGTGSGSFSSCDTLSGFTTAQFIAVADFDRDGDPDLAVADSGAGVVRLFRGLPGGASFALITPVSVGSQPRHIAVADLDRNGTLDLAVVNQGSNSLTLLSGDGSGGFAPFALFSPLATSVKPTAVVAGDFNVDGRPDLAVSHLDSSTVAVYIALPAGGFGPAREFPLAGLVVPSLAAGDFNRDGKPDLAAPDTGTAKVAVLLSTSCRATRIGVAQQPHSCPSGSALSTQPRVSVTDDAGNLVYCDGGGNVTASLLGTGTLGGDPVRPVIEAMADWSSGDALSVTPGGRFRLKFQHDLGYTAVSRSFTLDLSVAVSGPTGLCAGDPARYTAGFGYDTYEWRLNATPVAVTSSYHMPGQGPGNYSLDLEVTQDACIANQAPPYAITVHADLSPISISVAGATILCQATGCTGGTAAESPLHTGGGTVGYRWGFRTVSGPPNPVTFIPGATNPSYVLNGPDFPGPGTYYLVLKITPTCGVAQVSNEVAVTVDSLVPPDTVRFFSVTSKKGENRLQWINPPSPPYGATVTVDIHRSVSPGDCSAPGEYPGNPFAVPLASVSGPADEKREFLDPGLADGTTYCYTLFVVKVPGTDYSAGRSNRGRPFDNSLGAEQEQIRWAYSVGTTSIVPPGVGVDAIHMVANDNTVHSVTKGDSPSSGTWPANWRPLNMNGPSQGRPTTITAGGLGAPQVIYLGSQGGNVYAINAETGQQLWSPTPFLAPGVVQAQPSGIFASFGSAWGINYNLILVGTRHGTLANKFYGLVAATGGEAFSVADSGSPDFGQIGIISNQALVDYPNQRVYFTSYAFGAPPHDKTVWCVSLLGGTVLWARAYGNIVTAPTLRGNALYVGTSDGKVKALDATTGDPLWTVDFDTGTGQPIKGYVVTDRLTSDLYFSTTAEVWAIRDDGTGASPKWTLSNPDGHVDIDGGSIPVFLPGGAYVYVGDGNGLLHRLDAATGQESAGVPVTFPLRLGDGSGTVGSPTLDTRQGFLYVGTDAGVVYAVKLIP